MTPTVRTTVLSCGQRRDGLYVLICKNGGREIAVTSPTPRHEGQHITAQRIADGWVVE